MNKKPSSNLSHLRDLVTGLRQRFILLFACFIILIMGLGITNISIQNNYNNLVRLHTLNNAQFQSWYTLTEQLDFLFNNAEQTPETVLTNIKGSIASEINTIENRQIEKTELLNILQRSVLLKDSINSIKNISKPSTLENNFIEWASNSIKSTWINNSPTELKITQPFVTLDLSRKAGITRLLDIDEQIGTSILKIQQILNYSIWITVVLLILFLVLVSILFLRPALRNLQKEANNANTLLNITESVTTFVEEISNTKNLFRLNNAAIEQTLNQRASQYDHLRGLHFNLIDNKNEPQINQSTQAKIYQTRIMPNQLLEAKVTQPLADYPLNIYSSIAAIGNHISTAIETRLRRKAELERDIYYSTIEKAFNAIPQKIAIFDENNNLVFFNDSFDHLFKIGGLKKASPISLADVEAQHQHVTSSSNTQTNIPVFVIADSGEISINYTQDENLLWTRIRSKGFGLIFIGQDLSSIKHDVKRQEQEKSIEYLGKFSSSIVHDSNNFLAIVINALELLNGQQALTTDQLDLVNQAIDACNTIATRNLELLSFTRRQNLVPAQIKPEKIGTDLELFLSSYEHIKFNKNINSSALIWADPYHLESLILNIVKNSLEAMDFKGIVELNIDLAPSDEVHIKLSDNGPGFSDQALQYAGLPFYSSKKLGTGLGLAAAKGFANQSDGRFSISNHSQGALVEIRLPLAKASHPQPIAKPSADKQTSGENKPGKILIVDDNAQLALLLQQALIQQNHEVIVCNSVHSAINQLDLTGDFTHLVTDIALDDGLGFELAKRCKQINPDVKNNLYHRLRHIQIRTKNQTSTRINY